jgi:hypothetical protein
LQLVLVLLLVLVLAAVWAPPSLCMNPVVVWVQTVLERSAEMLLGLGSAALECA